MEQHLKGTTHNAISSCTLINEPLNFRLSIGCLTPEANMYFIGNWPKWHHYILGEKLLLLIQIWGENLIVRGCKIKNSHGSLRLINKRHVLHVSIEIVLVGVATILQTKYNRYTDSLRNSNKKKIIQS